MNKHVDADTLSAEITQKLSLTPLEKALPPKLRYRFYKWLKQFGAHAQAAPKAQVKQVVEKAYNHIAAIKELKKNEVMTSLYDNGFIRMDFGGAVDKKVKDAAMAWAKKRGLKATEASLEKADGSPSHVIFGKDASGPKGICVKYSKYSI